MMFSRLKNPGLEYFTGAIIVVLGPALFSAFKPDRLFFISIPLGLIVMAHGMNLT